MVWGRELGHMHPREREVRVGKCSCLHYSANPGLRILGAGWGGWQRHLRKFLLSRDGSQAEMPQLSPPLPSPTSAQGPERFVPSSDQTQSFENN